MSSLGIMMAGNRTISALPIIHLKLDQILERKVKDVDVTYKNLLDLSKDYLGAT